jgi:hypothetical protein
MAGDVERTVTDVPAGDTRNDVLELLADGNPWVFVYAHDLPVSEGFGLKVEVGGGVHDTRTIRSLLNKTLAALPEED